jgi:TetR/AcrR family transcriptional repressor of nem operon
MNPVESGNAREKLLQAGIDLFRRHGFVATSVDEICGQAGVTKGAFFHHFPSKTALAEACLAQWSCMTAAMDERATGGGPADPVQRVLAHVDFYAGLIGDPNLVKSCLAGTTVQEVAESHPTLREGAHACFVQSQARFQNLLDEACRHRGKRLDTASLAALWMATVQGSLLLYKASRDDAMIARNFAHFRRYVATLLGEPEARKGPAKKPRGPAAG